MTIDAQIEKLQQKKREIKIDDYQKEQATETKERIIESENVKKQNRKDIEKVIEEAKGEIIKGLYCQECLKKAKVVGFDKYTGATMFEGNEPKLIEMRKIDNDIVCPYCKFRVLRINIFF